MARLPQEACAYSIEGNPAGPTLVFIHGWPDDAGMWRKQVAELGARFRCLLITLPNFGSAPVVPGGLNFTELVDRLAATIDAAQPDGAPVTLVTHDWGAYLGYLLEQSRPGRIEAMVALDIGGHVAPGSAKERVFMAGYQWTLILLWLIGGIAPPLGNWLTRRFAGKLGAPAQRAAAARSRYNYMYFYLWRGMLLPWWRRQLLSDYRPQCPVLYLWGRKKPLMFHSREWLETVARTGGRYAGIEGAGHWFMESHPEEVNRAIREWLTDRVAGSGQRPLAETAEREKPARG